MNHIDQYLAEFVDDRSVTSLGDTERAEMVSQIETSRGLDLTDDFFWTRLKEHRLLVTDEHDGVDFLDGLLPDDATVVIFDCDDFDHGYLTRFADAVRVIGESSYFEYLIYAVVTGDLIVENHHNELFVVPGDRSE